MTLRTMTAFMKASKEGTPVAHPSHAKAPVDDDSATGKSILDTFYRCKRVCLASEPESEPDVPTKRKSPASEQVFPPSKRIKALSPDGAPNF
jgi:hypothetical protein